MKAYKVRLYKLRKDVNFFTPVDQIVVFKKMLSVCEAVSGYSNINVVSRELVQVRPRPMIKKDFYPLPRKIPNGESLFIIQEEMGSYNLVKPEEMSSYVDAYESSEFKKLHDTIIQGEMKNQK